MYAIWLMQSREERQQTRAIAACPDEDLVPGIQPFKPERLPSTRDLKGPQRPSTNRDSPEALNLHKRLSFRGPSGPRNLLLLSPTEERTVFGRGSDRTEDHLSATKRALAQANARAGAL